MCFNAYKLLFLLLFYLTYTQTKAETSTQNEDEKEYSTTHIFDSEENKKNFIKNYSKIKEFFLQWIAKDKNKTADEKRKNIETFNTMTTNILEHSDYYKDISERDMLFNESFIDQALFTENHKGNIIIESLLDETNNETISGNLMDCINLITKNNWHTKIENLKNLAAFKGIEIDELQKIENIYKTFKEDEYELIKLFSEDPAKYRYDIDDYNWFIDFTNETLVSTTPIFTRKSIVIIILTIFLFSYIYKYFSYEERQDMKVGVEENQNIINEKKNKGIISKYLLNKDRSLHPYSIFGCKNLCQELLEKATPYIKSLFERLIKYLTNGEEHVFDNIIDIFCTNIMFFLPIIVCFILIVKLLLGSKTFTQSLFHKFYIISRYIKNAHILYNTCRGSKYLQIFLYNDLANLRRLFETQDKNLKDLLNTAINTSQNLYSINPFNVIKVSEFIYRFDRTRHSFHDSIIEFILFKNNMKTLNRFNSNMSASWSIPTISNGKMILNFKKLYNISLEKGGIPTDLLFDENNKGMAFYETNDNSERSLQQALILSIFLINAYGICPCENAEICDIDYIYCTKNIYINKNLNNSDLKKWIDVATKYFKHKNCVINSYSRRNIKFKPVFLNIMSEPKENIESKMFVNLFLHLLEGEDTFLYLIHHNDDLYKIKKEYPDLKCSNKSIEYLEKKNENKIKNEEKGNNHNIINKGLFNNNIYLTQAPKNLC